MIASLKSTDPWLKSLLLSIIPWLALLTLRSLIGNNASWRLTFFLWIFTTLILLIAGIIQPIELPGKYWQLSVYNLCLVVCTGLGLFLTIHNEWIGAAWITLGGFYALLLGYTSSLIHHRQMWLRLLIETGFAGVAGALPVLLQEISTRFSSEEFFAALQALWLTIFWLALRVSFIFLPKVKCRTRFSLRYKPACLALCLSLILMTFAVLSLKVYQASFYPPTAPTFAGITSASPFLCSHAPPSNTTYDGSTTFQRLLARVAANPDKTAPEYGMLAVATGEDSWAQEFRSSLLAEARQSLYTDPANSVKFGQYLAGKRVYYYLTVKTKFPQLFSAADEETIAAWFAAINRRTFQVGWVDILYGIAFDDWPQGPYENQANGAGLLSLLELYYAGSTSAPAEQSSLNREYLSQKATPGWVELFRNTDDAILYQPEWIENAWYQAQFSGAAAENNLRLAFEWLLLQSLPDGSPFGYNHPIPLQFAGIGYLGAQLLNDSRYLWMAGSALDAAEANGIYLSAQPGAETTYTATGASPDLGSCLLYGNSGLPTQVGPLAPDKIVLRSGWDTADAYLLQNLRFTGWHRYKATNTLTLLYQAGPLVVENTIGSPFSWLPEGRSLLRDKRIPRENLNGLVVSAPGLTAVIYQLTGLGSPWAQDPPFYATVDQFSTTPEYDLSVTTLEDWHGWDHTRTTYFYHDGLIVIQDDAYGPSAAKAAFLWNFITDGQSSLDDNRLHLRSGDHPAEVIAVSLSETEIAFEGISEMVEKQYYQLRYSNLGNSRLETVTVFLLKDWVGAEITLNQAKTELRITSAARQEIIPLQ